MKIAVCGVRRLTCAGMIVLAQSAAWAQGEAASYPTKPVRLVVPFAPGGSSEIVGRLIGHRVTKQIEAFLTGSNYPAINGGDVKALEIPLPALSEQTAIAAILSDMDAEIAALETRRDKTRALKQGMMQELLTGRTRLV